MLLSIDLRNTLVIAILFCPYDFYCCSIVIKIAILAQDMKFELLQNSFIYYKNLKEILFIH